MSKEEAIAKLIPVFRRYGYEGATLSRMSAATGLKKASLYHYFPGGKEEMAEAVLEYGKNWFEETIFTALRQETDPARRIEKMCQNLNEFYCRGEETCLLNVMALGEGSDRFQEHIKQALRTWIEEIARVLVEAGIEPETARKRAEDAIIQIQGTLVLTRGLEDLSVFDRIIKRLPGMLLDRQS